MKREALALIPLLLTSVPADAAHWTIDPRKSRLGFTVQWSGEPFVATFKSWTADISFDPSDLSHSHIAATIELASESSDTHDNDEGLKGPEGFAADRFRSAKFETTSIASSGAHSFLATGTLSLHGFKRTVRLPFELTITGNIAHAAGRTQVLRSDFGLGTGEWANDTPIAHEVTINFDLTAKRAT